MVGLAILFGVIVGFALGLTGGGGGIFAVPLLVFGLSIAPREAIGVSLASVGGTALLGVIPGFLRREVEISTGLIFALAGMIGAPIGVSLAAWIPEGLLLILFAVLMLIIAMLMWRKAHTGCVTKAVASRGNGTIRFTCRRTEDGQLVLTSRCAVLMVAIGLLTGVLSGLFGVGGGFVIVPALVLLSGMQIHQAVATSLMVIVLVSVSGVSSYLFGGGVLSLEVAAPFIVGGIVGIQLGRRAGKRLSGPHLQQVFAVAVLLVAVFIVGKSVIP